MGSSGGAAEPSSAHLTAPTHLSLCPAASWGPRPLRVRVPAPARTPAHLPRSLGLGCHLLPSPCCSQSPFPEPRSAEGRFCLKQMLQISPSEKDESCVSPLLQGSRSRPVHREQMVVPGGWEGVGVSVSQGQSLRVEGWHVLEPDGGGGCPTV